MFSRCENGSLLVFDLASPKIDWPAAAMVASHVLISFLLAGLYSSSAEPGQSCVSKTSFVPGSIGGKILL